MSASVVPPIVRIRVAVAVLASCALSCLPWLLLAGHPERPPWMALSGQIVLVLLGLYIGWCLWPRWQWFIPKTLRGSLPIPKGQRLCLTLDDGPTPGLTDAVLDLLRDRGLRASFFVLLPKARENQRLIRRIVTEGHLLGLHGEDHRAPFFRSADELAASLMRAKQELEALAGEAIELYRPSHGWKNVALVRATARAGLKFCFWNIGVWDTDAPSLPTLLARLRLVSSGLRDGQPRPPVVLVHDGLGDIPGVPPHGSVLLAALIEWAGHLRSQPGT